LVVVDDELEITVLEAPFVDAFVVPEVSVLEAGELEPMEVSFWLAADPVLVKANVESVVWDWTKLLPSSELL
jgi:hypothetical protein